MTTPVTPEPFAVTVKVIDSAGEPVPGLRINLTSDNDFMQDHFRKAAVTIPFSVLTAVRMPA